MKALGMIFLILGLGGVGVGVYGMSEISAAEEKIAINTEHLEQMFPGAADNDIDFTDIEDLVAIDRYLSETALVEHPEAAWNVLNAMGDREDGKMAKTYGFAAGGGLVLLGLIFFILGMRKKKEPAPAA